MADLKTLQPVEKSNKEVRKTVLTNVVKMLTERGYMTKTDSKDSIKRLSAQVDTEGVTTSEYQITLDKDIMPIKDKTKDKYHIKIISQKITTINKTSDIANFLNKHKKSNTLLIVDSIGKKAVQFIGQNYEDTEVFTEEELMINLVDHVSVPNHVMLTDAEVETFYTEYNAKKRNMPRILTGDPVARYYNMKPNDIVRIIRASSVSVYAPFYRLVVKGEMKK